MKYGLDPLDVRTNIVVPVLEDLNLLSDAAVSLVLGTAMQESHLKYLRQLGNGPAVGYWQMEPFTHDDCWRNFLFFRRDLKARAQMIANHPSPTAELMVTNHHYACAMSRIRYRRVVDPVPANDPLALATYWKRWYNTRLGKGTIEEALPHFTLAVSLT